MVLLTSFALQAEVPSFQPPSEKYYQVEVVVFEQSSEDKYQESFTGSLFDLKGASSLSQNNNLVLVDAKNFVLKDAIRRLTQSKDFRVLLQKGWKQPIYFNTPIYIEESEDLNKIDALIKVQANHTLLLDADFVFTTPDNTYRLKEKRAIKKGVLEYLDHPKYGILVMITDVHLS